MAHHIHRQGDHVDIPSALAVAEKRAFNPVGPSQYAQFRRGDACAPVIVRMQRQDDVLTLREVAVHPLDTIGVDVRRRDFHRRRQVDDGLVLGCRLPDVHDRLADFHRIRQFGLRITLGRILMDDLRIRHRRHQFLYQLRAIGRDFLHPVHVEVEDDPALCRRRRVVQMDDRRMGAVDGFEGTANQLVAGLRQNLDHHVARDQVFFDYLTAKFEIRFGRCRKPNFDLLESHIAERLKHLELALRAHRLD